MEQFKTNFPRFLYRAKEVSIVLLQCLGVFAAVALAAFIFHLQSTLVFS